MNTPKFQSGDAVQAQDGADVYLGVVLNVYDDVVEIQYMDARGRQDVMEFHEDDVAHYPVIN